MPGVTDVLDDFNRADASTLGANWSLFTDFGIGGNDDFSIISNAAALGASGQFTTYDILYWNVSIFGPDCETFMTLSTAPVSAFSLLARGRGAGAASTVDGYYLDLRREDTPDSWRIYRLDNGVSTQLGATVSQNLASGNDMLFECRGSTLKGYLNTGSGWSEIISRTDTTYNDAGWIGFYGDGNDTAWRYDDFGGGTLSSGIVYAPNLRNSISGSARVELWLTTDAGARIAQLTTGLGFEGSRIDGGMGWFSYRAPASFDDSLFQPDRMLQFWYQPAGEHKNRIARAGVGVKISGYLIGQIDIDFIPVGQGKIRRRSQVAQYPVSSESDSCPRRKKGRPSVLGCPRIKQKECAAKVKRASQIGRRNK